MDRHIQTAAMVGDRFYDVVGAPENDVRPVGALWGLWLA